MPSLHFEEILPYRAVDLYDLVMDVALYPQIFPEVKAVEIVKTAENYRNVDVTARAPFLTFKYNCDVEGEPPSKIMVTATEGAFESMQVHWTFDPLPDGRTRVGYEMSFDFGGFGLKNKMAESYIRQTMGEMRARLRDYIAEHLKRAPTPVAGSVPAPAL